MKLSVQKSIAGTFPGLVDRWQDCRRCPLHAHRKQVVFARCRGAPINGAGGMPERLATDPFSEQIVRELRPPEKAEVSACKDRTDSLLYLARPKAVVLLGETAKKWIGSDVTGRDLRSIPTCQIYHPAYLLRSQGDTDLIRKRLVLPLTDYLRETLE